MQFLTKTFLVNWFSPTPPKCSEIARHRFSIQCLTFDVIPSKNIWVNWPHFSLWRVGGLKCEVFCADLDISCTIHPKRFWRKWPPTPLPMGLMTVQPGFCAFLNILCNNEQKCFHMNLASTLEGKNPVIAGRVSFYLHFGGITLLFWQLSYQNIFKCTFPFIQRWW